MLAFLFVGAVDGFVNESLKISVGATQTPVSSVTKLSNCQRLCSGKSVVCAAAKTVADAELFSSTVSTCRRAKTVIRMAFYRIVKRAVCFALFFVQNQLPRVHAFGVRFAHAAMVLCALLPFIDIGVLAQRHEGTDVFPVVILTILVSSAEGVWTGMHMRRDFVFRPASLIANSAVVNNVTSVARIALFGRDREVF